MSYYNMAETEKRLAEVRKILKALTRLSSTLTS